MLTSKQTNKVFFFLSSPNFKKKRKERLDAPVLIKLMVAHFERYQFVKSNQMINVQIEGCFVDASWIIISNKDYCGIAWSQSKINNLLEGLHHR